MKRLKDWSNRHPVISMAIGWIVLIAITLIIVPADPPGIAQAFHDRST